MYHWNVSMHSLLFLSDWCKTVVLSIRYDKYYQTPRVWLTGYDEVCKEEVILVVHDQISKPLNKWMLFSKRDLMVNWIILFLKRSFTSQPDSLASWPELLTCWIQTRHLLQPELVLEDVSQDHARKTVSSIYVHLCFQCFPPHFYSAFQIVTSHNYQ